MSLVKIAAKGVAVGLTLALVSVVKANEIKGKVSVQGIKSAENIAVYVDVIPDKKFDAPKDPVVVDQRKMAFVPHVVAVQQGTTVEFLNSDSVGHNVYWHLLEPWGSSFRSRHGGELLLSGDTWFAPSDLTLGPGGIFRGLRHVSGTSSSSSKSLTSPVQRGPSGVERTSPSYALPRPDIRIASRSA